MSVSKPRVLGIIPARGGSKGIQGKNIIDLHGLPLIGWTLAAARMASTLDSVIVSTDDPVIADTARALGGDVPFIRPGALATDTATSRDVVLHALEWVERERGLRPDYVVLLQPTSPFRPPDLIDEGVQRLHRAGGDSLIGVSPAKKHPLLMYRLEDGVLSRYQQPEGDTPTRRQELDPIYAVNGGLYVVRRDYLLRERRIVSDQPLGLVMDARSSMDIDEPWDLEVARAVANTGLVPHPGLSE